MTNNHMRLLTEQELQSIYGGNIFTVHPTFGVMGF